MAALSSCVCKPRIFGNWYYITLKFLFILSICLALSSVIYLAISPLFALNHNLFPSKWERNTKPKQPIRIQGLFKVTNQITGKCSVIYSQIALIFAPSHISFCSLDQWWRWGGGDWEDVVWVGDKDVHHIVKWPVNNCKCFSNYSKPKDMALNIYYLFCFPTKNPCLSFWNFC